MSTARAANGSHTGVAVAVLAASLGPGHGDRSHAVAGRGMPPLPSHCSPRLVTGVVLAATSRKDRTCICVLLTRAFSHGM